MLSDFILSFTFNQIERLPNLKDKTTIIEYRLIQDEIDKCKRNKSKAAKNLGISRECLRKKGIKYNELLASLGLFEGVEPKKKEQFDFNWDRK